MAAEQSTTPNFARSGKGSLILTLALPMVFLFVSELSRNQVDAYTPGGFFTAEARKCLTERIENLPPSTQRLCFALNSLVELADVVDEKTMEEALRRAGMDEEFLAAGQKFSEKHGTFIDPSVKRDDKYEHMFMRFGRKRRSPKA